VPKGARLRTGYTADVMAGKDLKGFARQWEFLDKQPEELFVNLRKLEK
jgi:hypothetical protein